MTPVCLREKQCGNCQIGGFRGGRIARRNQRSDGACHTQTDASHREIEEAGFLSEMHGEEDVSSHMRPLNKSADKLASKSSSNQISSPLNLCSQSKVFPIMNHDNVLYNQHDNKKIEMIKCFDVGIDTVNNIHTPNMQLCPRDQEDIRIQWEELKPIGDQICTPIGSPKPKAMSDSSKAPDMAVAKEDRGGKIEERKKKKTKIKTT